jgi:sulfatase modifying factor 1
VSVGEGPVREIELSAFAIEPVAVSNQRFAEFVDDTGHVTDAKRYGWSFVFGGLLPDAFPNTRGVAEAPWWREVFGASWRHPEGPLSSIDAVAEASCQSAKTAPPRPECNPSSTF